ncbi:MAG TPA: hypothetical protein VLB84_11155, partial [Bacteroidia bacterium]|nr:hypothetical protein [Bacteroidia bacterium]
RRLGSRGRGQARQETLRDPVDEEVQFLDERVGRLVHRAGRQATQAKRTGEVGSKLELGGR